MSAFGVRRKETAAVALAWVGLILLSPAAAAPPEPAAAPATAAPLREARGPHVVGPDGRPVPGALVSIMAEAPQTAELEVTRATATTRTDGSFVIPPATEPAAGDAARPARHAGQSVLIEAPGYGLAGAYLDEANLPEAIPLKPATELRVRLLGPDGKPAANLRIAPRMIVARRGPGGGGGSAAVVPADVQARLARETDAQGRVALPGLPRDSTIHLNILGDDRFVQLTFQDAVVTGGDAVSEAGPVRLKAGASLRGRVVLAEGGKPAAGVVVMAQGRSAGMNIGWGSAVTDADGRYRITRLAPGPYNVFVTLPEALANEWAVAALEAVQVPAGGKVAGQDLKLVKGGLLVGRLVAADTKRGLPGLSIGLHGPARPMSSAAIQSAVTRGDGSFSFRVPPGKQYVYFADMTPDGYVAPARQGAQEPTVAEGQLANVTLELSPDPNPPASGQVVLPDGKPAAHAWVTAEPTGDGTFDARRAEAGTDGRFRFAALAPGTRLRAQRDRLRTAEAVEVKAGQRDLTLRLQDAAAASLRVTVRDEAGKPVPAAHVQLTVWSGNRGLGSNDPAWVTGADGQYVLKDLAVDGRYSLWIEADGFGVGQAEVGPLEAGREAAAPPVVLRRADRRIAGRVLTRDGVPVAGVAVEINGSETGHQTTRTDAEGHYSFKVPPGARPLISMRNDKDQSVGAKTASADDETLDLVYDPAAVVR